MKRRWSGALRRGVDAAITKRVVDDRGTRRGLYSSMRRVFTDDPGTGIPQADFERVVERLAPGTTGRASNQWALAGVCFVCAALLFAISKGQLVWMSVALAAPVPLFIFGALTTRRWFAGFDAGEVKAALLGEGRCASCGYLLSAVPPEADGCTVCPECGAAWRLVGATRDPVQGPIA